MKDSPSETKMKIEPTQIKVDPSQAEPNSQILPTQEVTPKKHRRLEDLLRSNPLPSWRVFAWPVMALIAFAVVWANFAYLDEVTITTGEVVPQGKIKVVQHLEGGIIEKLYVKEGDTIKVGQIILQLDLASSGANVGELQARLDGAIIMRARLKAEAEGLKLQFPDAESIRQPSIIKAQRQTYRARKREFSSTLQVLREQVKQRKLEVKELLARQKAVKRNYTLARERLKMSTSLLAEGLTAKMEHLQLEAEVESLEGEMESLRPSIPKSRAAVEEARQRLQEAEIRFRREAKEQLSKIEQEISLTYELVGKATEQGVRTEIKSPIDGVIKNMRYNAIGNVVKPGEPIMEIVPTGEQLVIEAKLNPVDRGYVNVGQRAVVKISTYDFARYGGLDAKVVRVAPDASTDESGVPFFRVVVETEKNYLGDSEGQLPITPGMQATADIHTGQKSVMDYLIKPILKLRHEAFRER
ncbi:MAG: Type I secretion system membrane fusion protein PrsE [Alphaproteobacteria bacterium MarineAlpha3_Bin5]|nr:MAG: Type I secretion system membrane fusion protein PrsE [Alphaproteobacteria bacterium MarineAlpha3_Bin5]